MKDGPGAGRGGRVLSGHEERNHDMSDLLVGERLPGPVFLVLQRREHVEVGLEGGRESVRESAGRGGGQEGRTASDEARRALRIEM
jgi:hypothetical protein